MSGIKKFFISNNDEIVVDILKTLEDSVDNLNDRTTQKLALAYLEECIDRLLKETRNPLIIRRLEELRAKADSKLDIR
jgi:hypothetical protein